jgi:hypothetical protein
VSNTFDPEIKQRAAALIARKLEDLKKDAQEKREKGGWTFQKPMKDRTPEQQKKPFANEQYVGKTAEVQGISEKEIAAVRARGPARDDQGKLTFGKTKAEAPDVPTRSKDTYLHAGLKPDPTDPSKSKYDKEETEKGDWREVPTGATGIKTPYYRGTEQEGHRVKVGDRGKLKDAAGQDLDTSKAKGGHASGSTEGREIFAMDTQGHVFTTDPVRKKEASSGIVDDPHHSSLVHGEKVIGSGEFETYPAEKGTLKAVSDVSGHYIPKPGHTADAINELEAQGASMIGGGEEFDADGKMKPRNKRAMVELSYDEDGNFKGRTHVPSGGNRPAEEPIDKMMSKAKDTGAVTMDFERFSQTGGNLPQVKAKRKVNQEITDRGKEQPKEVLKKLKEEQAAAAAAKKKQDDQAERAAEWARKGALLSWTPDLKRLAVDLGAEFSDDLGGWAVADTSVNEKGLLAILTDNTLTDEQRKKEMKVLVVT